MCFVNALRIWDENTFIKNFYTNYSFFDRIWRSICFKLLLLNQINVYFSNEKTDILLLTDLRN